LLCSFFNRGTRWGWVVNATPLPLFPRGSPSARCIVAGCAPGPFWTGGENFASTGIRCLDHPAGTESLYPLPYPGRHLKVCTMEVIRRQLLWEILSFLRKAVLNKIHPSDGPALAIYISLSMDNAIRTKL